MSIFLTILVQLPLMGALVFLDLSTPFSSIVQDPLFLLLVGVYPVLLTIWWSYPVFRKYNPSQLQYLSIFFALALSGVVAGMMWTYVAPDSGDLVVRIPGRIAFTFLAVCLMMSPINILIRRRYETTWLMLRKITGVLSFLFFLAHALRFLLELSGFAPQSASILHLIAFMWSGTTSGKMTTIGLIAGIGMVLLGITSNTASYRLLSRHWKALHRLVYPIFVLSIVHVVWAERFAGYYTFLFVSVSLLRIGAFIRQKKSSKGISQAHATRYICVICGYVYDEALGDPDSGIAPGTRWEDIPDSWYCPICKVGKKDFEPLYDTIDTAVSNTVEATVRSIRPLTHDVIELTIELPEPISVLPGQFFRFALQDFDSVFERSYSVASVQNSRYTFLIKMKRGGRAGRLWPKIKVGDTLWVARIGWIFTLRDSPYPKIFLATGTGIAPIYYMLRSMKDITPKSLYFGVPNNSDLFYESELAQIPNLTAHIFLSGEDVPGYTHERINPATIEADPETEFYICGSPALTKTAIETLTSRGFVHVYAEAFD